MRKRGVGFFSLNYPKEDNETACSMEFRNKNKALINSIQNGNDV